jgi:hypothetical protein
MQFLRDFSLRMAPSGEHLEIESEQAIDLLCRAIWLMPRIQQIPFINKSSNGLIRAVNASNCLSTVRIRHGPMIQEIPQQKSDLLRKFILSVSNFDSPDHEHLSRAGVRFNMLWIYLDLLKGKPLSFPNTVNELCVTTFGSQGFDKSLAFCKLQELLVVLQDPGSNVRRVTFLLGSMEDMIKILPFGADLYIHFEQTQSAEYDPYIDEYSISRCGNSNWGSWRFDTVWFWILQDNYDNILSKLPQEAFQLIILRLRGDFYFPLNVSDYSSMPF